MGTQYNFSTITYKIIRKRRKTIGIKITDKGEVIITSPFGVSEETIKNIIKKKQKWITDKVKLIKEANFAYNRAFEDGKRLLFLGKELELEIIKVNKSICHVKIEDEKVRVFIDSSSMASDDTISNAIINLYRKEAARLFKERTEIYSKVLGVSPKRIFIKDQKTLWGSCSSKGNINYNYRIIMAPISIIDYIVVHELCHLIHMNHSKEYWNAVKSILPDYEKRRKWLKDNGCVLRIW